MESQLVKKRVKLIGADGRKGKAVEIVVRIMIII